jgi:translocation and assembly module TamA
MKWMLPLFFLFFSSHLLSFEYRVEFQGVKERRIISSLKESSETVQQKNKKPIQSYAMLRKRAEADLPKLLDVMRYYGYLDSSLDFIIERGPQPLCTFRIDPGSLYTVVQIKTEPAIDLSSVTFQIPMPAETEQILKAEELLLQGIKKLGFPFAKIDSKELVADKKNHSVIITFIIETGPKIHFGETTITGAPGIKPWSVRKHIFWQKGDLYNPEKIATTQESLERSGLFSSIHIQEKSTEIKDFALPMEISLQEAKHKSVRAGLSYTTAKGAGCMGEWEHRNVRNRGDKFTVHAELWQKFQLAKLTLKQPHYKKYNQDRIWLVSFERQKTLPFLSDARSVACHIERKWTPRVESLWGVKFESLYSKSEEGTTHTFSLAKLPLMLKCSSAKNLLDPLNGMALHVRLTPSYQFVSPNFFYLNHTSTLIAYCPITPESFTVAVKGTLGNIFGAARKTIPLPDRLFSGTENTLRGYRYLSVSPLNKKGIPIGGRSLLAGSVEARLRTSAALGCVFFYDVGNVYSTTFPNLDLKFLQSFGTGIRYATAIGPMRLDIAFPVHRRKHIDPPFEIYFSIGHSF